MQTVIVSKLLSLGGFMFEFIVLFHSEGHQFSRPVSTGACSVCWKEMTSMIRVEGMAVNAFLPFKFVAVLRIKASQETRLPWQTPGGVRLSTLPGGGALIGTVDAAMLVESVCHHCRAAKASVANESKLIMHCSKVIHNGPLVLP